MILEKFAEMSRQQGQDPLEKREETGRQTGFVQPVDPRGDVAGHEEEEDEHGLDGHKKAKNRSENAVDDAEKQYLGDRPQESADDINTKGNGRKYHSKSDRKLDLGGPEVR